jgi:hypothetical protein
VTQEIMNSLKKIAVAAFIASIAASGVQAQSNQSNGSFSVRGVVGAGITFGGDKLTEIQTVNTNTGDTSSQSVTAGGLLQLKGGVEVQFAPAWALQTTIGFHVHDTSISNGSAKFQRFPLEAIVFYQATPQFRFGAGLRKALSPKYSESGAVGNLSVDLNSQVGVVLEGEYLFTPKLGVSVRGVSEKYGVSGNSGAINGSHGGVGFNFYF